MCNIITLLNLLRRLPDLDDRCMIYASRVEGTWQCDSLVRLIEIPEDDAEFEKLPTEIDGLEYMIDVDIAKDAVEVWKEWSGNDHPSPEQMLDAVVYYAENDAYLPVEDES